MKRVFVVGCARSGTTYLQSIIAELAEVLCLPETQFFVTLFDAANKHMHEIRTAAPVQVAKRAAQAISIWKPAATVERIRKLQGNLPVEFDAKRIRSWSSRARTRAFLEGLDRYAGENGFACWAEKSPNHLYYIDEIEGLVPDARFIHIARDGRDVVASIVDAMRKNESWRGRYGHPEKIAALWNESLLITRSRIESESHMAISYDELRASKDAILARIAVFLGVASSRIAGENLQMKQAALVYTDEVWKSSVREGEGFSPQRRFQVLFSEAEQSRIEEALIDGGRVGGFVAC